MIQYPSNQQDSAATASPAVNPPQKEPKSHQSSPVRKPGIPNRILRHLESDLIAMACSQVVQWPAEYGLEIPEPLKPFADRLLIIIAIPLLQALVRRVFKPCPPTAPGNTATPSAISRKHSQRPATNRTNRSQHSTAHGKPGMPEVRGRILRPQRRLPQ